MISKKEYATLLKSVKLACDFGNLPATWNSVQETVDYPTRNKYKIYLTPTLLFLHSAYLLFILAQLSIELNNGAGIQNLMFHVIYGATHLVGITFHAHVLRAPREIASLFNLLGSFNKQQRGELISWIS